jgi:hypothetical protein
MTIKKFFQIAPFVFFIAFAMPFQSNAATNLPVTDSTADARIVSEIVSRVTEIQNMDKTNLSASEKKVLKNELNAMKHKAEGLNSRVYLSVGAIIIIILLLILIL